MDSLQSNKVGPLVDGLRTVEYNAPALAVAHSRGECVSHRPLWHGMRGVSSSVTMPVWYRGKFVFLTLLEFLIWLQPAATNAGGVAASSSSAADAAGSAAASGGMGGMMTTVGWLLVMGVIFYFLLIRPEQKRKKEHDDLLASIKKGHKVRTNGGILGEVVTVNDVDLVIQIADRVRINVLRSHVAGIVDGSTQQKAEASKASSKTAAKEA